MHQLGVQNRRACRAADRVVAERDELEVEYRAGAQPSDRHGHAAVAIDIERRLRTVPLLEIHDWLRRGGRKLKLLRPSAEAVERVDQGVGCDLLIELRGNGDGMPVLHRHTRGRRADDNRIRLDGAALELPENLLRLRLELLFFAVDERDDVAEDVPRGDTRVTRAGDGL